jgi:hypothetical protein
MSEKSMGTAERGYVAIGRARPLTEQEIQAGIARSMREVVTHDLRNPQALRPPERVGVANAPEVKTVGEGRGFIEDKPLPIHSAKGSREEALIDAMVEKFVGPPGGEKKDRK